MAKTTNQPQRRDAPDDPLGPPKGMAAHRELPPGVPEEQPPAPPPEGKPPEHGTAREAAAHGRVPRVVDQLERVPRSSGLARFKIRCDNETTAKTLYVLAKDEDSARDEFLKASGVGERHDRARKNARKPDDVPPPELVVVRLED